MADTSLPYVPGYGSITKVLNKIKAAQTPPRFTQDYLATKLDMPSGSAKPVIPFLKRTGFLGSDGTPTDLYKRFRNPASSGAAAAEALRIGYKPLYEVNEYIHDAKPADIKGAVMQVTGADKDSRSVQVTVASFNALKDFADFSAPAVNGAEVEDEVQENSSGGGDDGLGGTGLVAGVNLGYTINLHLPATSDVAVFNAIFKSLKEHLIR